MSNDPREIQSGEIEHGGSAFGEFIADHFGPDSAPFFETPIAATGIILCFVNRSGSNLLAERLASSTGLPQAREIFLKSNLLRHRQNGSGLSEVFEALVRKQTRNGIFATKLGFGQLRTFDSLGYLEKAFDRRPFIYLKRRDLLAQAISLEIAAQSRRWKSGNRPMEPLDLDYSRKRLELKMEGIRRKYHQFDDYFAARELQPFTVQFEDFLIRPGEILAAASRFLDLPARELPDDSHLPRPPVDPLKQAWKQRFLDGK